MNYTQLCLKEIGVSLYEIYVFRFVFNESYACILNVHTKQTKLTCSLFHLIRNLLVSVHIKV